jgi:hypothetical protein
VNGFGVKLFKKSKAVLTKLAVRERLEQLQEAILARVEDLARVADIDGPHLEATKRVVVKEVLDVRPRELDGRRRVVVERRVREALQPVREQLWHARHVDVRLDERVEEALVRHVHLRDPEHVVNVRDDGDALRRDEDRGAVARAGHIQDARLHDLDAVAAVLRLQVWHGNELVELANLVCRVELDWGLRRVLAVLEDNGREVRVRDRD